MITSRTLIAGGIVGAVATLAVVLIVVIVAIGPNTHANLGEPDLGFSRVTTGNIDVVEPFATPLTQEGQALFEEETADGLQRGRGLFFANGCATCHGLTGAGGSVGPAIAAGEVDVEEFFDGIRDGDKGMPQFDELHLSDEEAQAILDFLMAQDFTAESE